MGLFEFFFPHESQAMTMQRISNGQTKLMKSQVKKARIIGSKSTRNSKKVNNTNKRISSTNERITELENDLGFLSLLISGIITKLDQNDLVQKDDIKEIIKELDGYDGVVDGKLDINVLRGQTH